MKFILFSLVVTLAGIAYSQKPEVRRDEQVSITKIFNCNRFAHFNYENVLPVATTRINTVDKTITCNL